MNKLGLLASGVVVLIVGGCASESEPDPASEGSNDVPAEASANVASTSEAATTQNQAHICNGAVSVRYYNPSSCGGTVEATYPNGLHGWWQTAGGCSGAGFGNTADIYFHPTDGRHGGWVLAPHVCKN